MKPVPQKFVRTLGVSLVGLLAVLLIVFFVAIFFAQHRGTVRMGLYQKSGMMDNAAWGAPSVSITATPAPMMESWDGERTGMMGKVQSVPVNMMGTAPLQMMERKVTKNGTLSLQVASVDEAVSQVGAVMQDMGGLVVDSHFDQTVGGTKSGSLTVKVEVGKFDEALARLKKVATVVLSENVSGTDVTAQVIDLQARINNEKAAETTLQGLFDRAVKVSDVIEITDKLASVRSDIEALEGQMRYLNSQTDQASITVFMTEDVRVTADKSFRPGQALKESIVMLIGWFGDMAQGLIKFLVVGLPVLLLDGVILWVLYRVARMVVTRFWPGSLPEKRRTVRRR